MSSMLKKNVRTMATPPMVGVDLVCDERPLGISSTFTRLINIQLMAADSKKRNNANKKCLDKLV